MFVTEENKMLFIVSSNKKNTQINIAQILSKGRSFYLKTGHG